MELINTVIGVPLGYLMRFCWLLVRDYGIAIIIFTLLTKVIMFPISLLVQKNSIKMVKMKPQLEALRYQYVDDKDAERPLQKREIQPDGGDLAASASAPDNSRAY